MGKSKQEVLQGTLALLVPKTLDTMGPAHDWGIPRRIATAGRPGTGCSEEHTSLRGTQSRSQHRKGTEVRAQ